jgi:hypothetical protein
MSGEGKNAHYYNFLGEQNLDLSIKIGMIMHKFSQNIHFTGFIKLKSHLQQIFTQIKIPEVLEEFFYLK